MQYSSIHTEGCGLGEARQGSWFISGKYSGMSGETDEDTYKPAHDRFSIQMHAELKPFALSQC